MVNVWFVTEAFPTVLTLEWLLHSVGFLMSLQAWAPTKFFITYSTLIALLSHVNVLMNTKSWAVTEAFPTLITYMRLLSATADGGQSWRRHWGNSYAHCTRDVCPELHAVLSQPGRKNHRVWGTENDLSWNLEIWQAVSRSLHKNVLHVILCLEWSSFLLDLLCCEVRKFRDVDYRNFWSEFSQCNTQLKALKLKGSRQLSLAFNHCSFPQCPQQSRCPGWSHEPGTQYGLPYEWQEPNYLSQYLLPPRCVLARSWIRKQLPYGRQAPQVPCQTLTPTH